MLCPIYLPDESVASFFRIFLMLTFLPQPAVPFFQLCVRIPPKATSQISRPLSPCALLSFFFECLSTQALYLFSLPLSSSHHQLSLGILLSLKDWLGNETVFSAHTCLLTSKTSPQVQFTLRLVLLIMEKQRGDVIKESSYYSPSLYLLTPCWYGTLIYAPFFCLSLLFHHISCSIFPVLFHQTLLL